VTHLNDPLVVRAQYADDRGLRARQAIWSEYSGDDPKEALWDAIAAAEPRRVLEVGGGQGLLSQRVQDELGAHVVMVDQSEGMVELARQRGVRAEVGDVQDLPFPDGSFDTAVAAWMLYHVTDVERGLSELARVLEPGGRLIANTSSRHHNAELFELIDYPTETRNLAFNAENGEQILRRHFPHVVRRDIVGRATIRDRRLLVEYHDSLSAVASSPVPEDVELPFVTTSSGVLFVASR
jgi:SAM-dependent methyltransferase